MVHTEPWVVVVITVVIAMAMFLSYIVICFAMQLSARFISHAGVDSRVIFADGRFGIGDHGLDGFGGGVDNRGDEIV
jgi:hypothetical protein